MRSLLYVPADRQALADKAFTLGGDDAPDAVILDLEDGVAPSARPSARSGLAAVMARRGAAAVWVRVDPAAGEADAAAAIEAAADGLVVAKAELDVLDALVNCAGADLPPLVALVESARGVLQAAELADHPAVERLAIGEADLTADLGVARDDLMRLHPIRLQLVVASAAAGIDAPTGPVDTAFSDLDGLRRSSLELVANGFGGRSCIHPAQVPVVNAAFTPTADELSEARTQIEAFDAAVAGGEGVVVGADGRMIDEAVVRAARRTVSRGGARR